VLTAPAWAALTPLINVGVSATSNETFVRCASDFILHVVAACARGGGAAADKALANAIGYAIGLHAAGFGPSGVTCFTTAALAAGDAIGRFAFSPMPLLLASSIVPILLGAMPYRTLKGTPPLSPPLSLAPSLPPSLSLAPPSLPPLRVRTRACSHAHVSLGACAGKGIC
jgi:hypothetical protein